MTNKVSIKNILAGGSRIENRFIADYKDLKAAVETLKRMGYRIVLTQGVYDLIHDGHAGYLEAAKSRGDILIVGVDSDALTRKRKGPGRPVVPQKERLKMLVHLRHVDIVTIRDVGYDIGYLIKLVKPDVLVASKSTADFKKDQVMAYKKFCKEIVILPPQATTSTSARIRNLTIDGAEKLSEEIKHLAEDFINKIKGGL
jgi:D-beta-D-heptose 7-phosphate kinase/D-beta-D-heptose 1-phosphate adenosyltransferase